MKHRLFFPLQLDAALAVLQRKQRLDQAHGKRSHSIIGYTDRDYAVLRARNEDTERNSKDVCLLAIEIENCTMEEILLGDFAHFGPSARRLATHTLELDHFAQDRIADLGRFTLEIVFD